MLNDHFDFLGLKVEIGMQNDFHSSEMGMRNNKFSETKEFIYKEIGIGLEQEEKLIVEENDLKFYIISDEDVYGNDRKNEGKIIKTINPLKYKISGLILLAKDFTNVIGRCKLFDEITSSTLFA